MLERPPTTMDLCRSSAHLDAVKFWRKRNPWGSSPDVLFFCLPNPCCKGISGLDVTFSAG